jgi:hypothetical protein
MTSGGYSWNEIWFNIRKSASNMSCLIKRIKTDRLNRCKESTGKKSNTWVGDVTQWQSNGLACTSLSAEKKKSNPFMIKSLNKLGIEGNSINPIKGT